MCVKFSTGHLVPRRLLPPTTWQLVVVYAVLTSYLRRVGYIVMYMCVSGGVLNSDLFLLFQSEFTLRPILI